MILNYNRMKRKILYLVFGVFIGASVCMLGNCKDKTVSPEEEKPVVTIAVTGVSLNKDTLTIVVGDTMPLAVTVKPENATIQNVSWKSSQEDVASVDTLGNVVAKKVGETVITVTTSDGKFEATCNVFVTAKPVSDLPDFVTTKGSKFFLNGKEIVFRGAGQWIGAGWNDATYSKLASIGFNSLRLYLDTRNITLANPLNLVGTTLSDIDQNIALAKKFGMKIILNVHITPGATGISDRGFFTNPDRPERLAAFWKAIGEKYVNESTIAAFDIINEPNVKVNPAGNSPYNCGNNQNGHTPAQCGNKGLVFKPYFDQYQQIIQNIVDEIRKVDSNHIIIVERLWLDGGHFSFGPNDQRDCWQNFDGKYNFPDINDPANKYAYTYHCYEPGRYCHQTVSDPNAAYLVYPATPDMYPGPPACPPAKYNVGPLPAGSSYSTKEFLEYAYTIPLSYIREVKKVPAYLGEFGIHQGNYADTPVSNTTYKGANRGGTQYIEDIYDILLNKYGISSSFHPYNVGEFHPNMDPGHEAAFRKAFGTN